jgi:spermidine/putrescine-binding protein
MMKFCKRAAVLLLALALLAGPCVPAFAVKASECGLRVTKNDSYNKDGNHILKK